jgi:hypothetical protein
VNRFPVFHRETGGLQQQELMKNIWCPFYEDCLEEASKRRSLMDCSQCENAKINFEEDWRDRNFYCFLR